MTRTVSFIFICFYVILKLCHSIFKGQTDPRAAATAIRLQRSGYGYGKESRFYRGNFQSHKRPFISQSQTNRFGTSFGMPRMGSYGYGMPPNVSS